MIHISSSIVAITDWHALVTVASNINGVTVCWHFCLLFRLTQTRFSQFKAWSPDIVDCIRCIHCVIVSLCTFEHTIDKQAEFSAFMKVWKFHREMSALPPLFF